MATSKKPYKHSTYRLTRLFRVFQFILVSTVNNNCSTKLCSKTTEEPYVCTTVNNNCSTTLCSYSTEDPGMCTTVNNNFSTMPCSNSTERPYMCTTVNNNCSTTICVIMCYQPPFTSDNILAILSSEPIQVKVTRDPFFNGPYTRWSYVANTNSLQHSLQGNGRTSYNIISWNCRKGIIQKKDEDTDTFIEVKTLIQNKKPHILGVVEVDIYGVNNNTNTNRTTRFTTAELKQKLHIDGYDIELPDSWERHGLARILVYVSDEVRAVRKAVSYTHLTLPTKA